MTNAELLALLKAAICDDTESYVNVSFTRETWDAIVSALGKYPQESSAWIAAFPVEDNEPHPLRLGAEDLCDAD